MQLTGEQYEELTRALISAFPTETDLERMLRFKFDKSLEAIAGKGTLEDICFRLRGCLKNRPHL